MTGDTTRVDKLLATYIADLCEQMQAGHCARIDDLSDTQVSYLADELRERSPKTDIYILSSKPNSPREILTERAVELRNRKERPLVLLVPAGAGHAASSLDNSFERIRATDLVKRVAADLRTNLNGTAVDSAIRELRPVADRVGDQVWADFLATIAQDPGGESLGFQLWRIGLIPDHGENPERRLRANVAASRAISKPTRPTATVVDRLVQAGLRDGPVRSSLNIELEEIPSLDRAEGWTRHLGDNHAGVLTFECWPLADAVSSTLESVSLVPFLDSNNKLDSRSKLELGADGQLVCQVPTDGSGKVVVRWTTDPPKVSVVHSWVLEVSPPADIRNDDSPVIGIAKVRGQQNSATILVELNDGDLVEGTRFVVRLTARDQDGQHIRLKGDLDLEVDSQEFEVVVELSSEESSPRQASTNSLPEAGLTAAVGGLDDLSEDMVTWDLDRSMVAVRIGGRRLAKLRVAELLIQLQRKLVADPKSVYCFSGYSSAGQTISSDQAEMHQLAIPKTLTERRAKVLSLLSESTPRDTAESAVWTPELTEAVQAYLGTYRRTLENSDDDFRRALLSMDSLTVKTRVDRGDVMGVVLLPLHPIRLAWIQRHDELLRDWSQALIGLPVKDRKRLVDLRLVGRIQPANLPFTALSVDGEAVAYFDELTFGSGLYLLPGSPSPEADAAALCRAIGVERAGSQLVASTSQVGERLRAFVAAHPGMTALRILSLNPGEGLLLANALRETLDQASPDSADPLRLEVTAYTDHASFTNPLAPLREVQADLRSVTKAQPISHLMPPLSLSVRPVSSLSPAAPPAHVGLIQGFVKARIEPVSTTASRTPSLSGLLVPTVTEYQSLPDGIHVRTTAATNSPGGPAARDLTGAHHAHQMEVGAHLAGGNPAYPAIDITIDAESKARIDAMHSSADWVLTVERYLGIDLFEGLSNETDNEPVVLDYAPDFVDGIGDRLTVTTTQAGEVKRIVGNAMADLGLQDQGDSGRDLLRNLLTVSGRLALRLLDDSTMAREAVGLAALMMHLRSKGDLEGAIVVPVDAHPEIFGGLARADEDSARRCDILIVRVGPRSFKIECIEVKARQKAQLPQKLADDIADQVHSTERLLHATFFADDPARQDADLQWARLASLLHYYADRASSHGLIEKGQLPDFHKHIDRLENQHEKPEISLRGFVMSTAGSGGFPKKVRDVPIAVLTGDELGKLGFTTLNAQADENGNSEPATIEERHDVVEVTDGARVQSAKSSTYALSGDESRSDNDPGIAPASQSAGSDHNEPSRDALAKPLTSLGHSRPAMAGVAVVTLGQDGSQRAVEWAVSTTGSPHAFVLGIPGQGKSVTTRKILRDFHASGLPALVFDFHGDMAANPPPGAEVLDASEGLPFSPFEVPVASQNPGSQTSWEVAEIVAMVAGLGDIQRNATYEALLKSYEELGWKGRERGNQLPSLADLVRNLEEAESNGRAKNVRARLRPLTDFGLFRDQDTERFDPASGAGVVVDLSRLGLEEVQLAAGAFLLRKVYNDMFTWPQGQGMRLAVVLDEAHRLAKDVTLPKLMKEGRKYGLSVVVASQGIDDFNTEVLENAGTKVVFRTNFPASKKVAGFLRGRTGQDLSQQIEQLGVGQAYVSTPDSVQARKVFMTE